MAAPAYAADAPFTPRFAQTARGDIAAGGQHVDDVPGRRRQLRRPPRARGGTLNNNDCTMALRRRRRRRDHTSTRRRPRSRSRPARPCCGPASTGAADTSAAPRHRDTERRSSRHGALRRGRLLRSRHRAPRRRPHLDHAGDALPRLPRRDRAGGGRRRGHLLGRRRPGRHGRRPLRRLGAVRRLPRQRAADPAPERLRRARHGRRRRTPSRPRSRPSTRRPPAP